MNNALKYPGLYLKRNVIWLDNVDQPFRKKILQIF